MRISDWSSDVCSSDLLFLARDRRRLAELEAVVDAVVARQSRGQDQPDAEAGPAAVLQEVRIDVGRVDEEVRRRWWWFARCVRKRSEERRVGKEWVKYV